MYTPPEFENKCHSKPGLFSPLRSSASRLQSVPYFLPEFRDMADVHSLPLPVAKACSNCAKAKAKCDGAASTGKCSRYVPLTVVRIREPASFECAMT